MGSVSDEAPLQSASTPLAPRAPGGPLLIYGLGRSGRSAAQFAAAQGLSAEWKDARPTPEDAALMEQLGFPEGDLARPYSAAVAAPGVPIDHPDLETLRRNGAEIIGEVALAARAFPQMLLVGITGTAGKGGTTTLTATLLRAAGVNALEGGNIDPPLTEIAGRCEVAVTELSSFQLERTADTRFPVGVITNLGADHLDRHGSLENYHAAKLNLLRMQRPGDITFYRPEDAPKVLAAPGRGGRVAFWPQQLALSDGTPVLAPSELPRGIHPANAAAAILAAEAALWRLGRIQPHKHPQAGHLHQDWNGALAATFKAALLAAKPNAGRFEEIAEWQGIHFIEDSIATRTLAAQSALELAPGRPIWIVGGRDKGADMPALRRAAQARNAQVVAFGEDGAYFAEQLALPGVVLPWREGLSGEEAMQEAVEAAAPLAEAAAKAEGQSSVLLAPIGTSFDLYRNYKERGQAFRRAVQTWLERRA